MYLGTSISFTGVSGIVIRPLAFTNAVVLASGTLSPLESVMHLFPGLPPNRLHLAQPTMALQAWLTRQLGSPGWSQRLQALHDALPGIPQRQAATLLAAALARHAVGLPLGGMERRWALEDLWLDGRVQRRWQAFVGLVSPLTVERLLRELPAPAGWVVERHEALLAA